MPSCIEICMRWFERIHWLRASGAVRMRSEKHTKFYIAGAKSRFCFGLFSWAKGHKHSLASGLQHFSSRQPPGSPVTTQPQATRNLFCKTMWDSGEGARLERIRFFDPFIQFHLLSSQAPACAFALTEACQVVPLK